MRTIAICNPKGGSAKTTTAVNLAAALAALGQRVLLIDMDPQGAASSWLGVPDADLNVTRAIAGEANLADLVHETTAHGVQLVPASPMLLVNSSRQEASLAIGFTRAMDRLPSMWDIVLIDCPPTLGHLAIAPLATCNNVLVPVEAHVLALPPLERLIAMIDGVRKRMNPRLRIEGILACRIDGTGHCRLVVDRIRTTYPDLLMRAQVRESIRLAEAPAFRLPISTYAPGSVGDRDHEMAAEELLERLDGPMSPRLPPGPQKL